MPVPALGRRGQEALAVVTAALISAALFAAFYPLLGAGVCALTLVPAAVAGWHFGSRCGLLTATAGAAVAVVIVYLTEDSPGSVLAAGVGPGLLAGLAAGLAAGWARQDRDRLRAELDRGARAEAALRESEERYRCLVEQAADAIFVVGPGEQILDANRQACETLGYARDELVGLNLAAVEAGGPGHRPGDTTTLEHHYRRKDGTPFPVEVRVAAARAGGRVLKIVTARDATRRKRAEAALRESERRFRETLENTRLIAVWLDPAGRVVFCNTALLTLTGYARDEVIGRDWFETFVPAGERAAARTRFARAGRGGAVAPGESTLLTKAGGRRLVIWDTTTLRDPDGHPVGTSSLGEDVTDRRRAEAALRERARLAAMAAAVGAALSRGDDPGPMLADAARAVVDHLGAAFTRVWLLNPAEGVLELRASVGQYTRLDGAHARVRVGDTKLGRIARDARPILTNDLPGDPSTADPEWARREGMIAFAGFPLVAAGRVVGVLAAFSRRKISEPAAAALGSVAAAIAQAVDRWRAGDELRRSEERYRELAEGVPALVWMTGAAGGDYYNRQWAEYTGLSAAESAGDGWWRAVHPDDRPAARARWEAALRAGGPYETEFRLRRADGEYRWHVCRGLPVRDGAGPGTGWLGTCTDIDGQKRAEAALKESEEQFRRLFENSPIGIYRTTPDGRILLANPAVVRMCGAATAAALTARNLERDGTHAGYPRAEFRRRLEADGEVRGLEIPWLGPDGGPIAYVRENARVVRGADGAVLYYEGTLEDITDRKRAEDALREREALLQSVIAHIPCGVFWKDRDSVLQGCNERFAKDQGFPTPAAVVGRTDWDLPFSPAEAESFRSCDRRVMESGQPMLNIEEAQSRPGGKAYLLTSKVPLRDAAGAVTGVLGVYQDITERKQLEDQVRQKQKMEAVGQLAGGVAHDFNNLLTVINGYADLLLEDARVPDATRAVVAEVRKAGDRAAGLTRQLLAFGRRQVLEARVLDLNAVVTETGVMLRRLIGEDVAITTALDPALCRVKVDPVQIQQVLLNLAVNARDAMPGGGRLTIETRTVVLDAAYARDNPDVTPGPYALLAVTDTGCGMTAEVKARLFEPFFTTKGPGKGTGLGLATVYGIVRQSGGHVAVYTEVGVGTTFKVYLPRVAGDPGAAPAPGGVRGLPRGDETLLLAEDEPAVREVARRFLRACGYTVLEAANGEEAVRVAETYPGRIDLLVTDVVMPKVGGRQAAEALRGLRPGVRVLFMSGYTDDAVVRHGILEAEVGFLQKPFTPVGLAAKVREVLDASPSRAERPAHGCAPVATAS